MLTVSNQNSDNSYPQLSERDEAINGFSNFLEMLIDMILKSRAARVDCPDAELSNNERYNTLNKPTALQRMEYVRGNNKYEFELPIFMDLQGVDVAKARQEAINDVPQTTVTKSTWPKLIYNPAVMLINGFVVL